MRDAALAWAGENTRVGEVGRLGHVDDGNRDGGCAAVDYGVEAGFDGRDQVLDRNRGFGLPIFSKAPSLLHTPSPTHTHQPTCAVFFATRTGPDDRTYEAEPH